MGAMLEVTVLDVDRVPVTMTASTDALLEPASSACATDSTLIRASMLTVVTRSFKAIPLV
jgi:hypothetical protein